VSDAPVVAFTVDVESDCPPYLTGYRGIEEGLPALLELLHKEGVPGTFFSTGDVATRYPGAVARVVADGHELGSHGMTHRAFTSLERADAAWEIEASATVLRSFAAVTSFRAPYLRFPPAYLELLERANFTLDSSQAKYKAAYYRDNTSRTLTRVAASVTSSVLRLPLVVRAPYLNALANPVVLFVHPWEFVDLRHERLRIDCRFRTGETALACVRDVLRSFSRRGARFVRMAELTA
jgi:peptidoglycan/xylan/chitin deacetylase (PgdA/CDA1 family)